MTDAYAPDLDPEVLADIEARRSEAPEQDEDRLSVFAQSGGDISEHLTQQELATLGSQVVEDWRKDDATRESWKKKVNAALDAAAQEETDAKTYPWDKASNVKFPILTVAGQQFSARAYPAIVKGDEAVGVKVVGDKPQAPTISPQDPNAQATAEAYQHVLANWTKKQGRAKRIKTYLNYVLFYAMDDWEGDTDALLSQLPIVGTGFKKVYRNGDEQVTCSEYVNPLHLTVAMDTQSLKRCPRITQDFERYPYEIQAMQARGVYRDIDLGALADDDEQKPRQVLEQHRLEDLDEDGVFEPYIITVDVETSQVLRIEAAFTDEDIDRDQDGAVVGFRRWVPFVKFPFLRDPKGRFYEIGFGHLLAPLSDVIDTAVNELIDAGHAQVAGGGFIASGLRLQGAGQTSSIKWRPGEYKVVGASGQELRNAIYERTFPNPSPVLYQLLELMLGAAKDIASIKDVITGEASSNAPVGTTLALIEQGLQVFSSIYKRIYRALREEFQLIYECEARYGDPQAYVEVLDDPEANFEADFSTDGKDIVPVSDPTVVTKMQAMAKAQALAGIASSPMGQAAGMDMRKVTERILEAADIDSEDLFTPPQPNPMMVAEVENKNADTAKKKAEAVKATVEAGVTMGEHYQAGAMDAQGGDNQPGELPGMAGEPGDGMGLPGMPVDGQGAGGEMVPDVMGTGTVGGAGIGGPLAPPGA